MKKLANLNNTNNNCLFRTGERVFSAPCLLWNVCIDDSVRAFGRPLGSVESGADVEVHVATSPEDESVSDVYFNQKNLSEAHSQAYETLAR